MAFSELFMLELTQHSEIQTKVKDEINSKIFKFFSVCISSCLGASSGAVVACAAAADMDPQWLDTVFRDIVRSTAQYRLGPFSKHFDVCHIIEVNIAGTRSEENPELL